MKYSFYKYQIITFTHPSTTIFNSRNYFTTFIHDAQRDFRRNYCLSKKKKRMWLRVINHTIRSTKNSQENSFHIKDFKRRHNFARKPQGNGFSNSSRFPEDRDSINSIFSQTTSPDHHVLLRINYSYSFPL